MNTLKTFEVPARLIDDAVKVLNRPGATAGDYYAVLREIVGAAHE